MTVDTQGHLRRAEMPADFTKHSFRLAGSLIMKSLAVTAVDEVMAIGSWKAVSVAKRNLGSEQRPRTSQKFWNPRQDQTV